MEKSLAQKKIGIIGTGWVGGTYAKDFISRGIEPICYSLDPQYIGNKEKIGECDFVLIAVPSPTTCEGFSDAIVRDAVKLVGKGKTAVIKSTVLPGTTDSIQEENPDVFVFHAPEFLSEATALEDVSHPKRNIVGIAKDDPEYRKRAEEFLTFSAPAPFNTICSAAEAEFIKYARNCVGYIRIIFYNLMYDLTMKKGANWEKIKEAIAADPDNGPTYTQPVHKGGRGAAGNCFIKDYAAFTQYYQQQMEEDSLGINLLRAIEKKNIDLIVKSKKDLNLLKCVYGEAVAGKE